MKKHMTQWIACHLAEIAVTVAGHDHAQAVIAYARRSAAAHANMAVQATHRLNDVQAAREALKAHRWAETVQWLKDEAAFRRNGRDLDRNNALSLMEFGMSHIPCILMREVQDMIETRTQTMLRDVGAMQPERAAGYATELVALTSALALMADFQPTIRFSMPPTEAWQDVACENEVEE